MKKKCILLINGKKRHGKDFFASLLSHELNKSHTTEIMHFADPLKDIMCNTFNISRAELEMFKNSPQKHKIITTCREELSTTDWRTVLQKFGTECMKSYFGENVWVELLVKQANNSSADIIIVPDFRFKSEKISNFTIKIFNDDIISTDTHKSENDLNDFNFWVEINNTGRPDLTKSAEHLAKEVIKKL